VGLHLAAGQALRRQRDDRLVDLGRVGVLTSGRRRRCGGRSPAPRMSST
jgi:hypothetical protein